MDENNERSHRKQAGRSKRSKVGLSISLLGGLWRILGEDGWCKGYAENMLREKRGKDGFIMNAGRSAIRLTKIYLISRLERLRTILFCHVTGI
jgi:hypothetical protein